MDPSNRKAWNHNVYWLAIVSTVAVVMVMSLSLLGIPDGYDVGQHFRFADNFREAILHGQLIPAWGANDNHGLGSLGIRIYPPVSDFLVAVFYVVIGIWYWAFWASILFWTLVGGFGSYFWAKEFLPSEYSALAAIVFTLAPYHAIELYQFTLFSEFAASSILPFCFLFTTRVARRGSLNDILALSIATSLLILTHVPLTVVGPPVLGIYGLALLDRTRVLRSLGRFAVAGGFTLLLTSFYWLKVLSESKWAQLYDLRYTEGFYSYKFYLLPIITSIPTEAYYGRNLWVLDIASISVFLTFAVLGMLLLLNRRGPKTPFPLALMAAGGFSLFLASGLSDIIWRYSESLQRVQFPWRLLSVSTAVGAIAFAAIFHHFVNSAVISKRIAAYSITAILSVTLIFIVTQVIFPAVTIDEQTFAAKANELMVEDGCECFWPIWAGKKLPEGHERVEVNGRKVDVTQWSPDTRMFSVSDGKPTYVRVATWYHPYWSARVNGNRVPVETDESGTIQIPVTAAPAQVEIEFVEPAFLPGAKVLSAVTWTSLLLLFATVTFRSRKNRLQLAAI